SSSLRPLLLSSIQTGVGRKWRNCSMIPGNSESDPAISSKPLPSADERLQEQPSPDSFSGGGFYAGRSFQSVTKPSSGAWKWLLGRAGVLVVGGGLLVLVLAGHWVSFAEPEPPPVKAAQAPVEPPAKKTPVGKNVYLVIPKDGGPRRVVVSAVVVLREGQ